LTTGVHLVERHPTLDLEPEIVRRMTPHLLDAGHLHRPLPHAAEEPDPHLVGRVLADPERDGCNLLRLRYRFLLLLRPPRHGDTGQIHALRRQRPGGRQHETERDNGESLWQVRHLPSPRYGVHYTSGVAPDDGSS